MFRVIPKLAVYLSFSHPFPLSPLIHLVCPSKFCMTFFFSWVLQSSQAKLRTMFGQNLVGKTSEDGVLWEITVNREFQFRLENFIIAISQWRKKSLLYFKKLTYSGKIKPVPGI